MDRAAAQGRADRIRAFREELAALEAEGALVLAPDQRSAIAARHERVLRDLAARFDADTTDALKQMSWGMRITSLLGAIGFSAAAYTFLERVWGSIALPGQVAILIAAPLVTLGATAIAARRERTLYVASLLAVLSLVCFVSDLSILGMTFNVTPSPGALLAWSALAFALAYGYGLRLLLAAGIVLVMGFLSATIVSWSDHNWLEFVRRPESLLLAGLGILAIGAFAPHRGLPGFAAIYRAAGALGIFLPAFALSLAGAASYLPLATEAVEVFYQFAGLVLAGLAAWVAIRRRWNETTILGSLFFALFLFTRLYQWWWDWMPRYVFFLIIGSLAVGLLALIRRFRNLRIREAA